MIVHEVNGGYEILRISVSLIFTPTELCLTDKEKLNYQLHHETFRTYRPRTSLDYYLCETSYQRALHMCTYSEK